MSANFAVSVTIKAIDEVTKTVNQVTGNISKQNSALKSLNKNMASMSAPRSLKDSLSSFSSELSGIGNSLEMKRFTRGIEEGTSRAMSSFRALGSAAKTALTGLATSGVVIGGLSVASSRMFSDISKANADLKNQANRLGITPDRLQSYRLAAESMGAPQASVDSAFRRINDMGFQFKIGNTAPSQAIAALNSFHQGPPVSLLDEHHNQRPPELILREFAEKLKSTHLSQQTQVQFANDFLGAPDLLPFLGLGSQGMKEKAEKFQGGDYAKSDQATARYLEASAHLNASLEQLRRLASIEILPGFARGLEKISSWIAENQGQLKGLFQEIGSEIPKEMNSALSWVNFFVKGLSLLSHSVGLSNLAFTVLATTLAFKVGRSFVEMGRALIAFKESLVALNLVRTIPALIAAFPFASTIAGYLGIVAAISAVTYAVIKYRKEISGWIKSVFSFFSSNVIVNSFISSIGRGIESVSRLFGLMGKQPAVHLKSENLNAVNVLESFKKQSSPKAELFEQLFRPNKSRAFKESEEKNAEVTIRFENLPKGARLDEPKGTTWVNLFAGYSSIGETS